MLIKFRSIFTPLFKFSTKSNKQIIDKFPKIEPLDLKKELSKRYIYTQNELKTIEDPKSINIQKNLDTKPVEIIKERSDNPPERLSKYLSRSGICSRRESERLIAKGLISVDGKKINKNMLVTSDNKIQVFSKNGSKVPIKKSTKIWLFHKPRGVICTSSDPQNRTTIFQYIEKKYQININHLISVGRLDYNSEGLLILTNDGELARCLEMPENKIERCYRVRVYGTLDQEKLALIRKGVVIKGKKYGPFYTEILQRQTSNTWLFIKMETGKNREIRRVMQKFDLRVNRLCRVQYGPYKLGALGSGEITEAALTTNIKTMLYFSLRAKLRNLNSQPLKQISQNKEIMIKT